MLKGSICSAQSRPERVCGLLPYLRDNTFLVWTQDRYSVLTFT
jgi:hypothetical protein